MEEERGRKWEHFTVIWCSVLRCSVKFKKTKGNNSCYFWLPLVSAVANCTAIPPPPPPTPPSPVLQIAPPTATPISSLANCTASVKSRLPHLGKISVGNSLLVKYFSWNYFRSDSATCCPPAPSLQNPLIIRIARKRPLKWTFLWQGTELCKIGIAVCFYVILSLLSSHTPHYMFK